MVLQGPDKGGGLNCQTPRAGGAREPPTPTVGQYGQPATRRAHAGDDGWFSAIWAAPTAPTSNGLRVTNRYLLKLGDQIRVGRTLRYSAPNLASTRARGVDVALTGEEAGMDAAIMHTVPSNDDSMVLAVPEPPQRR